MKNEMIINHDAKTLTVTKAFMMKAGQFGTPEFEKALEAKRKFPGYALVVRTIKRNSEKWTYGKLTYEYMGQFIENHETDEAARKAKLTEFGLVKEWAKTQKAAYAKVKEWFLNQYKEEFKKEENEAKENS